MKIRRASLLVLGLSSALSAHAQNIVKDPGFESAAGATGVPTLYQPGQSFDGGIWTVGQPPSGSFTGFAIDKNPAFVISGTASAVLFGSSVSQLLATKAGQAYVISFDAYNSFFPSNFLVVGFGSTSVNTIVPQGNFTTSPVSNVTHYDIPVVARGASTLLSFGDTTGDIIELDNVSVTPALVPEPASAAALGLGALALLRRRRRG